MWSWIVIALLGGANIVALERNHPKLAMMMRALYLLGLLVMVITQLTSLEITGYWLIAGLSIALLADGVYCANQKTTWCFGAFLVVQFCYSQVFWSQLSGSMEWWLPALLAAACIVGFFLLLPQLERLIFPVTVMGLMLLQLSWAAGEVWIRLHTSPALAGFMGSVLLLFCALLLAIHGYRRTIPYGHYWISGGYLLANTLIVTSVL